MLQNYFQGPVIQVIVKPHGNSSCNKPIFHTSKEECQRLALQHTPSEAVAIMINDCGGEVHVRGASSVGHDQMHIKKEYCKRGQCTVLNASGIRGPQFYQYFWQYKADAVHYSTLKGALAHLLPFLQRMQSWSLNKVIKRNEGFPMAWFQYQSEELGCWSRTVLTETTVCTS